ncbi:glycosyltransferase family 2 protein [Polynucleobacter sp. 78F-HAINBA]|uniref:glycosyltransferase family 2 protein n=1 Tax=Polynucleobacter sp. 78F-HAINBA TaxID=2689099 RepID=UPI001C0C33FE|nr:glycosyltransferase family 2 protein [Polynucleobacter sp. 78F-HAINBA]MBU3590690.1 glycosyltransferase family 2 protein [Polynucleobacter sp. 78F-HAINBA]
MSTEIALTIGIPTYNGEAYLAECLDGVRRQINCANLNRVEILISDNASIDKTASIVREFESKNDLQISYHKNEINFGFDRNIDLLFKRAAGKFVWLLGDDDVLCDGAIDYALSLIDSHPNLKAIQVNFDKYDSALKNVIERIEIEKDSYCQSAKEFHLNSRGRWGAISSLIIKRESWNSLDLSAALSSHVVFAYGLFELLLQGDSFVSNRSIVKVRDGSEKAVKIGDGDSRIAIALASGKLYKAMRQMGYERSLVNWYLRQDRKYALQSIPIAKFWGIKERHLVIRDLINVHNGPSLWFKWIPYILIPDPIFKWCYINKKKVSSKLRPYEKKFKDFFRK